MPPQENNGAPIIPAGTGKTVFGGASYTQQSAGQPAASPIPAMNNGQGVPAPQQAQGQQAPNQQSAPEGITFTELAAKKGWKSPDDMARSYSNLESHNKTVEMTASDILKMVQEGNVSPLPAPVAQPTVVPQQASREDEAAINIVRQIVQAETKPLHEQIALQNLFLKNPEAKDYASGIAKAVKENPGISWENALKLAKFDTIEQNARGQGRTEAYQTIQSKTAVIAGTGSPAPRTAPDLRSIVRDRSVPLKEVGRMLQEALSQGQN